MKSPVTSQQEACAATAVLHETWSPSSIGPIFNFHLLIFSLRFHKPRSPPPKSDVATRIAEGGCHPLTVRAMMTMIGKSNQSTHTALEEDTNGNNNPGDGTLLHHWHWLRSSDSTGTYMTHSSSIWEVDEKICHASAGDFIVMPCRHVVLWGSLCCHRYCHCLIRCFCSRHVWYAKGGDGCHGKRDSGKHWLT